MRSTRFCSSRLFPIGPTDENKNKTLKPTFVLKMAMIHKIPATNLPHPCLISRLVFKLNPASEL